MSKKTETFRVNTKKNTITLYTNVKEIPAEKVLIEFYLNQGYTPLVEEKKKGKTVQEMRDELKANDMTAFEQFETEYNKKGDKKTGFFAACKVYNTWKKAQKKKEQEKTDKK